MKMLRVLAVVALASSATLAMADEKVVTEDGIATFSTFKPAQVRAEVGTTGYGGAVSWNVNPYTAVTLGYNGGDISWSNDLSVNGTKYDLNMENNTTYLNVEIRPFANWLYTALGVGYLDNTYDLKGQVGADGTVKINGDRFGKLDGNLPASVVGTMSYDKVFAPYVGFGISPSITSRFGFFGEVGAYYTGNPDVKLRTTNLQALDSNVSLDESVAKEIAKIENDDLYKFAFVGKIGLSVRF